MFKVRFDHLIMRFYLMMLVGILAVYTNQAWLIVVTFAIAVTAVLGYRFEWPSREPAGKIVTLQKVDKPQKVKTG